MTVQCRSCQKFDEKCPVAGCGYCADEKARYTYYSADYWRECGKFVPIVIKGE